MLNRLVSWHHCLPAFLRDVPYFTGQPVPAPVFVAVRAGMREARKRRTASDWFIVAIVAAYGIVALLFRTRWGTRPVNWAKEWNYLTSSRVMTHPEDIQGSLVLVTIFAVLLIVLAAMFFEWNVSRHWRFQRSAESRNFRRGVSFSCALLIIFSARVHRNTPNYPGSFARAIDVAARMLIRDLRRLPNEASQFERWSPRRQSVRRHVNLVAAAIQKQLQHMDIDPSVATAKLADFAMRICDAHLDRKWGQLLEDAELAGLEPLRDREPLRLAAAGLTTLLLSAVAALAGIPASVLPILFGLIGVLTFRLIMGGSPRSLELLDAVRGIQRP